MKAMKCIFFSLLALSVLSSHNSFSQSDFFAAGENGDLFVINNKDGERKFLGNYMIMLDIAVTPNGKIYGVNSNLYELDIENQTTRHICLPQTSYGRPSTGRGLTAVNDSFLISDNDDSLFLINVNTGVSYPIGNIGDWCYGDFAFFDGFLYMIDLQNNLVKITLNSNYTAVVSIETIGTLYTEFGSGYSLFSVFESCSAQEKKLYMIDHNVVYEIDPNSAMVARKNKLDNDFHSWGAASAYELFPENPEHLFPNVISPNGDQINDTFAIYDGLNLQNFSIFNRWGNEVYKSQDGEFTWNGNDQNGDPAVDGTYYITAKLNCRFFKDGISGILTILK